MIYVNKAGIQDGIPAWHGAATAAQRDTVPAGVHTGGVFFPDRWRWVSDLTTLSCCLADARNATVAYLNIKVQSTCIGLKQQQGGKGRLLVATAGQARRKIYL